MTNETPTTPEFLPTVGERRVLVEDVDRYPHFLADAGLTGEVVSADEDLIELRLDEDLPGAEEWDNAIHFYPREDGDPVKFGKATARIVEHPHADRVRILVPDLPLAFEKFGGQEDGDILPPKVIPPRMFERLVETAGALAEGATLWLGRDWEGCWFGLVEGDARLDVLAIGEGGGIGMGGVNLPAMFDTFAELCRDWDLPALEQGPCEECRTTEVAKFLRYEASLCDACLGDVVDRVYEQVDESVGEALRESIEEELNLVGPGDVDPLTSHTYEEGLRGVVRQLVENSIEARDRRVAEVKASVKVGSTVAILSFPREAEGKVLEVRDDPGQKPLVVEVNYRRAFYHYEQVEVVDDAR